MWTAAGERTRLAADGAVTVNVTATCETGPLEGVSVMVALYVPAASDAAVAVTLTEAGVLEPEAGVRLSHVADALAVHVTELGAEERLSVCAAVGPAPAVAENVRLDGVTVNVGDCVDETVNVTATCEAGPLDGVRVIVALYVPAANDAAVAVTLTVAGVAEPDAGVTLSHVAEALVVHVTDDGDEERLNVCAAVGPVPAEAENDRLDGVTVNVGDADTVNVTGI